MSEILQQQDSRRVFVETLNKLAEHDNRIVVLICDVGFNYLNDPNLKFRVINTGVTEQSTVLIAAAMALDGFKPYVYSMINFVLFRPYEMVRNGIVHHKANVKLIGVKGSTSYKFLGFSHNMTDEEEDVRTCKNLGLKCRVPSETEFASHNDAVRVIIKKTYEEKEPCYIRL